MASTRQKLEANANYSATLNYEEWDAVTTGLQHYKDYLDKLILDKDNTGEFLIEVINDYRTLDSAYTKILDATN